MSRIMSSLSRPPLASIAENEPTTATQVDGLAQAVLQLPEVRAAEVYSRSNLSFREVEQLLDWLENHGIRGCDCIPQPDGLMTVRWYVVTGNSSDSRP